MFMHLATVRFWWRVVRRIRHNVGVKILKCLSLLRMAWLPVSLLAALDPIPHAMDRTVFDRWAKSIRHRHQKTQASQLYSVRSFLAYYAREHPTWFVPDSACFPKQLLRQFLPPFLP